MILNYTPHQVIILSPECCDYDMRSKSYKLRGNPKVVATFPPQVICPRCTLIERESDPIEGIPTVTTHIEKLCDLPKAKPDTYLIVSAIVANQGRNKGRKDLLVPSRLVRNEDGFVVGCLALGR